MKITIDGQTREIPSGTRVLDALRESGADRTGVLAVRRGCDVLELADRVPEGDCSLFSLTMAQEEGRRIYERSLRFVMLLALHRLYPGQRVRVEHSVCQGVLVRLQGHTMTPEEIRALDGEMRSIISADLPIRREVWPAERAIAWYLEDGQTDKAELLRRRGDRDVQLHTCEGMIAYLYGAIESSTGLARVFSLHATGDGFTLQMPEAGNPGAPGLYVEHRKHLTVFAQSVEWCRILGVENAADLAGLIERGGMRTFIRVNEALQARAIAAIADEIIRQNKRVVLVAGPSSSGKTTFAARLAVQLRVLGRRPIQISLDNYYLDRDKLPVEADGSVDLETIHALDLPLLREQINGLLRGDTVEVPVFDFRTGRRVPGTPVNLSEGGPVIFEGIHGLNPMMSEGIPREAIHKVFVSALTCLNLDDSNRIRTTDVRMLRRMVRDYNFRGTSPARTLAMWPSVRAGERKWIFPFQEEADSMFNTALHYELPFLKHYAYGLLYSLPLNGEEMMPAMRMRRMLRDIPDIPEDLLDEVPPTSLLREFIGGSTFDKG